ncbi:hypothetical protein WG922_02245 [Ramlibacter sp. AN1015]|uniref:hypothetical protein n=1 Tax=Ramlibacter sp. AN1015 TaxID=3133428 RepID=UPI0030BDE361
MKPRLLIAAALATCAGSAVFAQSTATVDVTASVLPVCVFQTLSAPVSFDSIRPDSTEGVTKTVELLYRCTKNMRHKVEVNESATGKTTGALAADGSKETLPVSVKWATAERRGLGFSDNKVLSLELEASIEPDHFRDLAAGDYRGVLLVTVTAE